MPCWCICNNVLAKKCLIQHFIPYFSVFVPVASSFSLVVKLDLTDVRKNADEIPAEPNIMHITMI